MLEKDIERKVCEYAREQGYLAYKFTSPQRAAVPDRLFISPTGCVFFVEFKQLGKMPTPAQYREHDRLRGNGVDVYVIDNVAHGKELIEAYL